MSSIEVVKWLTKAPAYACTRGDRPGSEVGTAPYASTPHASTPYASFYTFLMPSKLAARFRAVPPASRPSVFVS
jgi:hypothetical protein